MSERSDKTGREWRMMNEGGGSTCVGDRGRVVEKMKVARVREGTENKGQWGGWGLREV